MAALWRQCGGTAVALWRHSGGTLAALWRHNAGFHLSTDCLTILMENMIVNSYISLIFGLFHYSYGGYEG